MRSQAHSSSTTSRPRPASSRPHSTPSSTPPRPRSASPSRILATRARPSQVWTRRASASSTTEAASPRSRSPPGSRSGTARRPASSQPRRRFSTGPITSAWSCATGPATPPPGAAPLHRRHAAAGADGRVAQEAEYLKVTPAQVRGQGRGRRRRDHRRVPGRGGSRPGTRSGAGSEADVHLRAAARRGREHDRGDGSRPARARDEGRGLRDPRHEAPLVTIDTPRTTPGPRGDGHGHGPRRGRLADRVGDGRTAWRRRSTGSTFTASGVPVGTGRITAQAEDAAGNGGETSIALRPDRNAPDGRITSPPRDVVGAGPARGGAGTVADAEGSSVLVEVNGQVETGSPADGPAQLPGVVDAGEGPLDLVATARDAAGNAASTPPYAGERGLHGAGDHAERPRGRADHERDVAPRRGHGDRPLADDADGRRDERRRGAPTAASRPTSRFPARASERSRWWRRTRWAW